MSTTQKQSQFHDDPCPSVTVNGQTYHVHAFADFEIIGDWMNSEGYQGPDVATFTGWRITHVFDENMLVVPWETAGLDFRSQVRHALEQIDAPEWGGSDV